METNVKTDAPKTAVTGNPPATDRKAVEQPDPKVIDKDSPASCEIVEQPPVSAEQLRAVTKEVKEKLQELQDVMNRGVRIEGHNILANHITASLEHLKAHELLMASPNPTSQSFNHAAIRDINEATMKGKGGIGENE